MRKSNDEISKIIHSAEAQIVFDNIQLDENHTLSYARVNHSTLQTQNTAIVMIHGSPGSLDAYISYMQDSSLLSRAQIYSVDRPGFGGSNFGESESSLKHQSESIISLVQTLKEDQVILVGHSFGCAIIARMAMDYPDLIDGFVSIAGTISPEAEPHNWWRKIVNFGLIRIILPRSLVTCNSEMLPLKHELYLIKENWKDFQMPITIIHGTTDGLVSFKNLTQTKKRMQFNSNARFVEIENDGHMILWTMPDRMISEIHLLLDRL